MNKKSRHILLTGPPGCGKTTLVKKIHACLRTQNIECFGFYTEELRIDGRRQGFDVVSLEGERSNLAKIMGSGTECKPQYNMVGRYSVDVTSFEKAVLPIFSKQNAGICIIDEIGKMELLSKRFENIVSKIFGDGNNVVLATIPEKPLSFISQLKSRYPSSTTVVVNVYNRDNLVSELSKHIIDVYSQDNRKH